MLSPTITKERIAGGDHASTALTKYLTKDNYRAGVKDLHIPMLCVLRRCTIHIWFCDMVPRNKPRSRTAAWMGSNVVGLLTFGEVEINGNH